MTNLIDLIKRKQMQCDSILKGLNYPEGKYVHMAFSDFCDLCREMDNLYTIVHLKYYVLKLNLLNKVTKEKIQLLIKIKVVKVNAFKISLKVELIGLNNLNLNFGE